MTATSFAAAVAVIAWCTGGAAGAFFCLLAGRLLEKPCHASRFSVCCLLLSIACGGSAFLMIFALPRLLQCVSSAAYMAFAAGFCLLGLLCICFWKILLPLALVAYMFVSALAGIFLYSTMGLQKEQFTISVQGDCVKLDGLPLDLPPAGELTFEVYTLPALLILPLPRQWYRLSPADKAVSVMFPQNKLLGRMRDFCWKRLRSTCRTVTVPFPDGAGLPALFRCRVRRLGDCLEFQLLQDA